MRNSEVRTSSRTLRKVSYVESEESEEVDEGKKKKSQKALFSSVYRYPSLLVSPLLWPSHCHFNQVSTSFFSVSNLVKKF
ncbi:hypothetical protein VNO80_26442 [Phaseolus coccineus]|uniref:Uncharacterized protein n=1 Tax=Phaseolus coccineus TaxID=3886 RepID=A0AAN9LF20_PHACN